MVAVIGTTTDLGVELDAELLPALLTAVDVAARAKAVIVTGGTDAGVFHLVRLAIAVASRPPAGVIGVAPDGLVAAEDGTASPDRAVVDPGLTALVRVKGDQWGDETPMLSRVVTEVAAPGRAVVLLVGGGDGTSVEVKEHLRQRRPIVVLGGSGRMADDVATGAAGGHDEELRTLLANGDVRIVPLSAGVDDPQRRAEGHPGHVPATVVTAHAASPPRAGSARRVSQAVVPRSSVGTAPAGGSPT